jgi:uncharacterized membrane protein
MNFNFGCENKNVKIDSRLFEVYTNSHIRTAPFKYVYKIPRSDYKKIFSTEKNFHKTITIEICDLPNFPYLYHAFVLKLTTLLPFSGWYIIFTARFLIFLGIFIIIFLFLKKYSDEFISSIVFFILSIPMVIHQLTSFSYDAILILFTLLNFIYVFYLRKKKIKIKDLILLFILYEGIFLSKSGYEFLAFTFFLIPIKNINISKRFNSLIYFLFFILILLSLAYIRFSFFNNVYLIGNDTYSSPIYINSYLIKRYPSFFIEVLSKTYDNLFKFYLESLIGIFGWLDYGLEYIVYITFISIFGFLIGYLSLSKKAINYRLNYFQIINLILLISASILNFLVFFYITYSNKGEYLIKGVQGRYFISFLPFLIILIINLIHYLKRIFLIFIIFIILNSYIKSIYYRYFDYYPLRKSEYQIEKVKLMSEDYKKLDDELTFYLKVKRNYKISSIYLNFINKKYDFPIELQIFNNKNKPLVKKIIPADNLYDWQEIYLGKVYLEDDVLKLIIKRIFPKDKNKILKINKNIIPVYYPK